ncbi:carbamoyltransferase HypF [Aestuariirhabdus sp. Z084]|uniref:carbamoyltransferase HypF n=1 Tax=Aestuariirhabdus haliotis TaxID=2918751 RepID=UPI00201B3BD2|nr:carbamoyltransferase HypF [Aestuariirhabdus haliotis]MCL6415157.1 carbamoyltransferase HypF [Aestuariirhabdus haliotis]MCL6420032.1 carbamoyltransferase HypF [Aestuariirhabdus haliotis]
MGRAEPIRQRLHLSVFGLVQGVGFRPFVYGLAQRLELDGWVANDGAGVQIEIEGEPPRLAAFQQQLHAELPPLAEIDQCQSAQVPLDRGRGFRIITSMATVANTSVAADAAVCRDCLQELFDADNRRYRYPFINCTNCGPRYTIIRRLPYDRPYTSMAPFTQCPACQSEYDEPNDRRFHAQPNACSDCGPQLRLVSAKGKTLDSDDPLQEVVAAIAQGKTVAVKGLGGFHLVCDADNPKAVNLLRQRKQRDQKPLAVMVANLASLEGWVELDASSARQLHTSAAPIVLLKKCTGNNSNNPGVVESVAPDIDSLGIMLPYTPVHHLLFFEAAGRPRNPAWRQQKQALRLVMTSANPAGEPLVIDNDEALQRLTGMVDLLLIHDRAIDRRCDDSVMQAGTPPMLIRRGRGLAPQTIRFADEGPQVAALGSWFKNTICVTKQQRAYVSPYIGDLDNADSCRFLKSTLEHMIDLFAVQPSAVACDLHPDFYSTRLAEQLAQQWQVPLLRVQHHHAHIASVMAEHHLQGPVIGVALDGVGLGTDGSAWGGELLRVDKTGCERLGHFSPVPLPGGDRAAREPWRIAAALLHRLGRKREISSRLPFSAQSMVTQMLDQWLNCPLTTSAGRWFDGVAALLGVCSHSGFEAQAAMQLEALAGGKLESDSRLVNRCLGTDHNLDLLPLVETLVDEVDPVRGAKRFHGVLADALLLWTLAAVERQGIQDVVLSGGCFLNRLLRETLVRELTQKQVRVWLARQLPCNDGGISLGQAWVARNQVGL